MMFLHEKPPGDPQKLRVDIYHDEAASDYLTERQCWLIRLRWLAIAGVALVVSAAVAFEWVESASALFALVATMIAYNLVFWQLDLSRRTKSPAPVHGEERCIALQILCDLTCLTALLHFSGGMENPFAAFFAFHMAIGGMLLPLRASRTLCFAACALFGSVVLGEYAGILPHHHLLTDPSSSAVTDRLWQSTPLVTGYLLAFTLTQCGVLYFVHSVAHRGRVAQARAQERERVSEAMERMARIGEISAGVSHAVRNPLHGLLNCVQLLRALGSTATSKQGASAKADCEQGASGREASKRETSKREDNEQDEILELMTDGLNRIENVTRRLLQFSNDSGTEKHPTDVNELIRDALPFARSSLGNISIDLQLGEMPPIDVDADKIGEVIINLLDNAAHACRGRGEIVIQTTLHKNTDQVCILVQDTGEGIPAERLPHIFDPFFTSKSDDEGSGLGLAIARSVVEEHGGSIRATSAASTGTTFSILLPIARDASPRKKKP